MLWVSNIAWWPTPPERQPRVTRPKKQALLKRNVRPALREGLPQQFRQPRHVDGDPTNRGAPWSNDRLQTTTTPSRYSAIPPSCGALVFALGVLAGAAIAAWIIRTHPVKATGEFQ